MRFAYVLRLPVALVFLLAGVSKWWMPDDLERVVVSIGLGQIAAASTSWVLPPLEVVIGIGLLLARPRLHAQAIAVLALLLFTIFLVGLHLSGANTSCGCFGRLGLDGDTIFWAIGRNIVLVGLLVASWGAGHFFKVSSTGTAQGA